MWTELIWLLCWLLHCMLFLWPIQTERWKRKGCRDPAFLAWGSFAAHLPSVSTMISFPTLLSASWKRAAPKWTFPGRFFFLWTLSILAVCAVEAILHLGTGKSRRDRVLSTSSLKVIAAEMGWLGKKNVSLAKSPCPICLLSWWVWLPEDQSSSPGDLELLVTICIFNGKFDFVNLMYISCSLRNKGIGFGFSIQVPLTLPKPQWVLSDVSASRKRGTNPHILHGAGWWWGLTYLSDGKEYTGDHRRQHSREGTSYQVWI